MGKFIRSGVLTVVIFIGVAQGFLVMGPKFIRPNQNYTLVFSHFDMRVPTVDLAVKILKDSGNSEQIVQAVNVTSLRKNGNKIISMKIPADLAPSNYKITIDGLRGYSYHQEADLTYPYQAFKSLIQIDKPVFKPGDMVQYRVIVLDSDLKPPAWVKTVQVTIHDPESNLMRHVRSAKLFAGVFDGYFQLASTPMLGIWSISVKFEDEVLTTKTFEVKEYVLSSFGIDIVPNVVPLQEHESLDLTISADYYFGKPVVGLAKVELFANKKLVSQKKQIEINGKSRVELPFSSDIFRDNNQFVTVTVTFTEQYTNRTVSKNQKITVFEAKYDVQLVKDTPFFHPNQQFKCALQLRYHDGKPVKGMAVDVQVSELDIERKEMTNSDGRINLVLNPSNTTVHLIIEANTDDGQYFNEEVKRVERITNAYLKVELQTKTIKANALLTLFIRCNDKVSNFVYYVMSKGVIIDSDLERRARMKVHKLEIKATEAMMPKAKILVLTVVNGVVVYDYVDIDFGQLQNNFEMTIDEEQMKPGRQLVIDMNGRPGSYVGLAAYDQSLLSYGHHHDLFWDDIKQVFNDFHGIEENEFDKIHSLGLFARTIDGIKFEGANDKSARFGMQSKLIPHRTNFLESWLWQNVTIGRSGALSLTEIVPDTTTSWYLTGFSIHPKYGLGIIKKPLEFTTVQPFYIVENLPYSIKRGEAVVLQFTLFNDLGSEYIADVTLHNVAEQMEFVGRPVEEKRYTKSVSVPPKVGVPVSFLVKPKKLGEMAVRVEASIMNGLEADALEKIVRVMPESLVYKDMKSRFFSFDEYKNKSINVPLNIDKKADKNATKIQFLLTPNLLTTVVDNLENLLGVPTGCGEQNMVKFVPNIVVLDYLTSIDSKDTQLITKATNLLLKGYQNQIRYRQSDGSYGVFYNGGSVFLTAFVAKSMLTASKYITEIDKNMVEKAYEWLVSKQHSSGRFDEVGAVIHKDMQGGLRGGNALTSYVLIALLENSQTRLKYADQIGKGMRYISSRLNTMEDPYDLSLATYALNLNEHSQRGYALEKLIGMSLTDNNGQERYWTTSSGSSPTSIETTGYALLSLVAAGRYTDGIPLMKWLVNQRYVTGSFPRTQDTFVGLKALTKLAEKISPSRNDYQVQLKLKTGMKTFFVNSNGIGVGKHDDIPPDTKQIDINVGGIGFGLLQIVYEFSVDLRNIENRFNLEVNILPISSEYELQLRVCANYIPNLDNTLSNMALIEVFFPSGYVVGQNPISDQTMLNPIQKTEIRYGSTSIVLYYNNMGREKNCFTVTAYRRFKVALRRPAYVHVHDYYNPKLMAIKMYHVDNQEMCNICEEDDCPEECEQ